jgi:cobyrinic acid a,c-diamide synthase
MKSAQYCYIAAPQKSSGKTTLSIGLCRELHRRGLPVRAFKKGPDYIDPLWLARATGRTCFNLDFHTMSRDEIRGLFARELGPQGLGVIEGNMGLFDDTDIAGATSNAELAKLLGAPVVLVIDCRGLARGIAPLLLGYQAFDRELRIAGVVLNKVGGQRHAATLRRAVEHYTDLPVIGSLDRAADVEITERHLGLIPANEAGQVEARIEAIRRLVADQVDVDLILELAATAGEPDRGGVLASSATPRADCRYTGLRVGIARDEVFGFYYPDDLRAFERAGVALVDFSPLRDTDLPAVDALFIGGGFPECRMEDLQANRTMREAVAGFIAAGRPVYAECGGLMYLCRRLRWGDRVSAMCGVLQADVEMHPRPQGRGYVRLRETEAFPWPSLGEPGAEIRAHEFHYSAIDTPSPDWRYAYEVVRGTGIDGRHDGIVHQRLLASYSHLRDVAGCHWPWRFLAHVANSS